MRIIGIKIGKDSHLVCSILAVGLLFMLFFKMKHAIAFMNLDEFLWMYRSRFFIDRIISLDFGNLIQSAQPGIMVMWLSGPFMKLIDYDFGKIQAFIESLQRAGAYNVINDLRANYYAGYEYISLLFNIPIILTMIAFVVSAYAFMLKAGFSKRAAFFSLALIATTPYYVFFTTPTDKLVGMFSILSILALLAFEKRKDKKGFLVLSGLLASWAAITKMSALFLIPFTAAVIFAAKTAKKESRGSETMSSGIKKHIREFVLWIGSFFASSVIFFPTILADPAKVLELFTRESVSRFSAEKTAVIDEMSFLQAFEGYLMDSSLLTFNIFIILVFIIFLFLIVWKIEYRINMRKEILILYVFTFSFLVFVSLFSRTYSFRYLVPSLLTFQIIAGVGICELSEMLAGKTRVYSKNEIYAWAAAFIFISQALLIYYSEIVPIS